MARFFKLARARYVFIHLSCHSFGHLVAEHRCQHSGDSMELRFNSKPVYSSHGALVLGAFCFVSWRRALFLQHNPHSQWSCEMAFRYPVAVHSLFDIERLRDFVGVMEKEEV